MYHLHSNNDPAARAFPAPACARVIAPAVALLLALGGCASVNFEEFKEMRASRWPERENREGVICSCRSRGAPEH